MKVYKFGGVAIQNSNAIRNLGEILKQELDKEILIVLSAIGKTTNALEDVTNNYFYNKNPSLDFIKTYHYNIIDDLFEKEHFIYDEVNNLFLELEWILDDSPSKSYDYYYDQIVSFGELLSSKIVHSFLHETGFSSRWVDARDIIRTDNKFRNARIDWILTERLIKSEINQGTPFITQGFIGCTSENFTTTLGREGSDFTAAIIANISLAKEIVIWKDVPGILSSDPRYFKEPTKINKIPYNEAIELAYFGAKVIHPKTIQPLQAKQIPLTVRSFLDLNIQGTIVSDSVEIEPLLPFLILKKNQVLISISSQDLGFIIEDHLSHVFSLFFRHGVKVNVMQNSALSFSVCVDNECNKISNLIMDLKDQYRVLYNENLLLYTIRHYDQKSIHTVLEGKQLFLEQKSRNTIQLVVSDQ